MLVIRDGFLGYKSLTTELFSGSDSVTGFVELLKTQPSDWYYRTAHISYQRNSLGHRCKDISEIDLDNYFLVVGCSYTEGIGIELEKTYPYLLSKIYNCDYYNLGIAGTGLDVVMHNLIVWFSTVKKKPKFIVIQVPTSGRFVCTDENPYETELEKIVAKAETISSPNIPSKEFILIGEELNFFSLRYRLAQIQYQSFITCPIVELHTEKPASRSNEIEFDLLDRARDMHPGILSNESICKKIAGVLKTQFNEIV